MYNTLLVDDFEIFRESFKALDIWGDRTGFIISSEASNGKDALRILQNEPIDLLITDIRMPILDGLDLLKRVQQDNLCEHVVLMSQFSDFEYARQGLKNGALEYLVKPVEKDELLQVLSKVASQKAKRKAEIEKISYYENILEKDDAEPVPLKELKVLMDYIIGGNTAGSKSVALEIVERICRENESKAAGNLVNVVMLRLIDCVEDVYPWFPKLTDLHAYRSHDFSVFRKKSDIRAAFCDAVDFILTSIHRFELGIDNSSLVRKTCKYILESLDTDISLDILAHKLFISKSYLSQIFKEKSGVKLIKYMTFVKMERARQLIITSNYKNYEIAEKIGYGDYEYFSRLFKKTYDMTPTEYRSSNLQHSISK